MKRSKYPPRIETTTFGDMNRTFLEPCYEPGVEWAINHAQQAEEYCQQRTTWWERLVAAMRAAW